MSMRDEYRTKAAEFQARALCESNEMTRLHFDNLAKDYLQLAELAAQIDNLRAAQDRRFRISISSAGSLAARANAPLSCPVRPPARFLASLAGG
jgi:hypothetical protein